MVKTKSGRNTNNSNGKKRAPSPKPRQCAEKTKGIVHKLDKINVANLADDDPTTTARRSTRGFMALADSNSNSSEEESTTQWDTPRRGDDKKRQRFAEVTEIIEIEKDESISSSIREPPRPIRLLQDEMDTDSDQSEKAVTIADILGEGPEGVTNLQQPLIITKDCRYTLQLKVMACDNPFQAVTLKFSALFTWIQDKVGKEIGIATWDDSHDKQKTYTKPSQLPKATETTAWTSPWGSWMNLKPGQDGTTFLKIRFVTKSPDVLTKRLPDLGELRDEIAVATGFQIGRSPIPCQAVQVGCVGWLFGSNKYMNSHDLLNEISSLINLPDYVRIGLSWRAIKLENGRTPPWIDNVQPASALHIDMDWLHAPVYKPELAKLFKKHGTTKPLGVTLRLIPCFSSDEGKNATQDQRIAAVEMREKQEYLIKEHITVIKTPYILNLDKPTKPNGTMTLRRYLKNLHPQGLVAARLILSVDKAWQQGSKDTNIITTKEYAPQVQEALRNMIPACVHRFGKGTKGWFSREGLLAFQGVKWDPNSHKSVSDNDIEALRTVTEDYFGMGIAWRKKKAAPTRSNQHPSPISGTPTASIPESSGKQQITADQLLDDLANGKADAPSFGDLYQRPHDGDTAKTSRIGGDDMSLSSHESDEVAEQVTLANMPTMGPSIRPSEGDASTAKSSTHYRLQRDKSREMAAKSQEESRQLLETLKAEREELIKAKEEIERLRVTTERLETLTVTQSEICQVTPSATRARTGTAADSAGNDK